MPRKSARKQHDLQRGKLRIGDDWNAITIIALSQTNPLKAVAEFVENSIDARARNITITRGRRQGAYYLAVTDDGEGIPKDPEGKPDFQYVATHICDSLKRQLDAELKPGVQGEYGIGLLSFWTVGEELSLTCGGDDGKTYQMTMAKGDAGYTVRTRKLLFPATGTELRVQPVLPGLRKLSGEKIQWYLASELRDRIRQSGVTVRVVDRTARKELMVEPRTFDGRLLHQLQPVATSDGEIYLELYLAEPKPERRVGLYRRGTRVLESIAEFDLLDSAVWGSGYLEGIIDIPYLSLTPGTRSGIIYDERLNRAAAALEGSERTLAEIIKEQQKAEEEHASRQMLRTIQRAFREALLALPAEEYDWFDIRSAERGRGKQTPADTDTLIVDGTSPGNAPEEESQDVQRRFFEFAGPLYSVRISPASCVIAVGETRALRAIARDKSNRLVEQGLFLHWEITEGEGVLSDAAGEIVTFEAPSEPALVNLRVTARQEDYECSAQALITVTDSLLPENGPSRDHKQGLPGYTFKRAPGELWRSRYDADQNVIVINNGHRDFVFAARKRALKLRYIARLFAKEMVLNNFPGLAPEQLLERMIELSLYTEEHLR